MPIKVKLVQLTCSGCGVSTTTNNYYEGDNLSPWCDDCFVTDEKLKELQAKMPFCQPPKKVKCRVVAVLKSSTV